MDGGIRIYGSNVDGKIQIIVEDSGVGISAEDIKLLFTPFLKI
jgi:signal transduction histidine kinase